MQTSRILLIHGAATTPAVWGRLLPMLAADDLPVLDVTAPERPSSGDLTTEVAHLADAARGSLVVGVGGGATLGLALIASEVPLAGAVLHEPAVGSLVPGLLDHAVAGYTTGGVPGFAQSLYGPGWGPEMAQVDPEAVGRDLAMFRRFEPTAPAPGQGPALSTVGDSSPEARHRAAHMLTRTFGIPSRVLPGSSHFVQHDNPAALAIVILDMVRQQQRT